jgi:AcrR family transcriptional regulator
MTDDDRTARPGRRRSETSRQSILAAVAELVTEVGYGSLTIEKIAQRAGTGKQTIYRWWPSKADVVMEALATKADLHIRIPDEGNLADDLRFVLRTSFAMARNSQLADLLRALMAEAQVDSDFRERFQAAFLQRRRQALQIVLHRGAERGELPAGVSVETLTDVVFGTLWYRVLAIPAPLDDQLADELVLLLDWSSQPCRPGRKLADGRATDSDG